MFDPELSEDQLIEKEIKFLTSILDRSPTERELLDFQDSQSLLGQLIAHILNTQKQGKYD